MKVNMKTKEQLMKTTKWLAKKVREKAKNEKS